MWKSLILDLLVPLHNRIFLASMWNYETNSALSTIKTAGLYHVPIKSYSKNTHRPFILKWITKINDQVIYENELLMLCTFAVRTFRGAQFS